MRSFIRHWNRISRVSAPSTYASDPLREEESAYQHHLANARQAATEHPLVGEAFTVEVGEEEAMARVRRWLATRRTALDRAADESEQRSELCMGLFHRASARAFSRILVELGTCSNTMRLAMITWYMYSTGDTVARIPHPVQYRSTTYHATLCQPRRREVVRVYTGPQVRYSQKLAAVGPLRPGPSCDFVGRLHQKVGARPQTFGYMQKHIDEFLSDRYPEFRKQYGGPNKMMVGGGWDTNREHVQRMADHTHVEGTYHQLLSAARRASSLDLRRCPLPTSLDMGGVRINYDAEPGWVSKSLGRTRARAASASLAAAEGVYAYVSEHGGYATSAYLIGGRERRNDVDLGGELRSRAILMPETLHTLVSSLPAQQLTAMLAASNSELVVGQAIGAEGQRMRLDNVASWPEGISRSLDFSGYDSRLTERLIVSSFGVLAACFTGDRRRVNNVLGWICSSFLDKHVITPGGFVYRLKQGTPSGHPWTTLINSVANWLIQVSVHDQLGIPDTAYYCEISGDDVRLHYRDWRRVPSLEDYTRVCHEMWGMVVKPGSVTTGYIYSPHVMCAPDFLATRWPCGVPVRDRERLLDISLLPAKPKQEIEFQFGRIKYMETNFPIDSETWKYHWDYFDWVNVRMPEQTRLAAASMRGFEERACVSAMIHSTHAKPLSLTPLMSASRKGALVRDIVPNHRSYVATGVRLYNGRRELDCNPIRSAIATLVRAACPALMAPEVIENYFGPNRGRAIASRQSHEQALERVRGSRPPPRLRRVRRTGRRP
nr:putative RNA-dependent RNA polymerase [Phytophthora cactorum usti-like virus 1]